MTVKKTLHIKSWTRLFRLGFKLKFRLPNLYTIIVVKTEKGLLNKRERVKGFLIFKAMLSFKQAESNYIMKQSCKWGYIGLLSFLIVWILVLFFFLFKLIRVVHTALTKKICEANTFDVFSRKVSFPFKGTESTSVKIATEMKKYSRLKEMSNFNFVWNFHPIECGEEDILLWKLPQNFSFIYFIPGNSRQNKAQPMDIPHICVT